MYMKERIKLDKYKSVVYNNCYYKFLNNNINIYNSNKEKINEVKGDYKLITFYDKYYYVLKNNCTIIVLNNYYEEQDCIKIDNKSEIVSFVIMDNLIYLATKDRIFTTDMCGNYIEEVLLSNDNIYEYESYNLKGLNNCCITKKRKTTNITSIGVCNGSLYVGFTKNNQAYLGSLKDGLIINTQWIECSSKIISILCVNKKIELLISKYDCYTYLLYDGCKKTTSCKDEECSIIDSIAKIECGIADIIESETKKINKVVETEDICNILKVNGSVTKMISNITLLETVLIEKLELEIDRTKCK